MLPKRLIIILCGALFCLTAFYLWDNILILDDSHPDSFQTSQIDNSLLNTQAEQSSQNIEYKPRIKKGYHIFINLDELLMYVYKDNQLLKTYPVSGGKVKTPSPLGTWKIISKANWGEGFGGSWMGFNVPWGKYGIHGTVYPWLIGKSNASKGCIRMKNEDAAELYKIVPHGTIVTISQNNRVFRTLQNGDIGSDVLEVQKGLKELGYFHGYPDGVFGSFLSDSVKKFQKENKLWGSGSVTKQTYDLILQKQKQHREEEKKEEESKLESEENKQGNE